MYPRYNMIYRGAEAELWKSEYLDMPAIEKHRIPKTYRIKEIDERIRHERLVLESNMITASRNAINTPHIFDVDLKRTSMLMEFIPGSKVRDLFLRGKGVKNIGSGIGKEIAALHSANIIHGDLTTSNMILKGKKLYFIDFGLAFKSEKAEDKAVDLVVFKKMLKSTHYKHFDEIWNSFLKGYSEYRKSGEIIRKMADVEKRARYVER